MIHKNLFFVLCLLITKVSISAQTVSGKVIDSMSRPIDAATVVLQTRDSVFIDATITDTLGNFLLKNTSQEYRLIVQSILYKTQQLEGSGKDAGIIVMKEQEYALNEVIVKGERPQVKVENGKLTYDIARFAENKVVSNAYESLLQLPGVNEINGVLSLAGASSVTVILNGKPTSMSSDQLMNLLKSTPTSRIEKAEVMYSAPPQYHVRGAAINLVVKGYKSGDGGWQGEVNGNYAQKYYASASGGASLLYTSPKWNVDFLYNADYTKKKTGANFYSQHTLNEQVYNIEQHNSGDGNLVTHNARMGIDYNLTQKSKLSFFYTTAISPDAKRREFSTGNFSQSQNNKKIDDVMHNLSVDYSSDFGFTTGVNYTYYQSNFKQKFENKDNKDVLTLFDADARQKINRWKVYVDQSHNLFQEWTLNYGTSFMYANDHNTQFYTPKDGVDRSDQNSNSRIKEYTYNLYAGINKSFDEKFSISLSVAGEYYKLADYNNWSVYPSAEMTYVASPTHIFQLSFSSDKTYPSYWEIQESVGYLNGYMEIYGNPFLKPSTDYSTQLSYILKSKYVLTAYYSYVPDYFDQLAYQSPDRLRLIYQTLNWNYKKMLGLNIVLPFNIGSVLDSRLTLNGFKAWAKSSNFHGLSFNHSKWSLYANLNNTISISSRPDLKMEISGTYLTPTIQGFYDLGRAWSVDAGLKWTFANRKAELRLKGTDLFNRMNTTVNMDNAGQRMHMNLLRDSRMVNVSFTYKFGGYKKKDHKEVDTSRFGQ